MWNESGCLTAGGLSPDRNPPIYDDIGYRDFNLRYVFSLKAVQNAKFSPWNSKKSPPPPPPSHQEQPKDKNT